MEKSQHRELNTLPKIMQPESGRVRSQDLDVSGLIPDLHPITVLCNLRLYRSFGPHTMATFQ